MPQPDDRHAPLAALAGTWIGEETMHPTHWVPDGAVAQAEIVNRLELGGFVVAQDYTQRRDGEIVFQGHGVFWVDPKSGEQHLHWWDSMGMAPEAFRGTWDGDRLQLRSQGAMGHARTTWVLAGDTYTHAMEMSPDGEAWSTVMEGRYRRTS